MRIKKLHAVLIAAVVVIAAGFIVAPFFRMQVACTLMACNCEGVEGEMPCNACGSYDPVFMTGLMNFARTCDQREIIICNNGTVSGRRYTDENCTYQAFILGFPV